MLHFLLQLPDLCVVLYKIAANVDEER